MPATPITLTRAHKPGMLARPQPTLPSVNSVPTPPPPQPIHPTRSAPHWPCPASGEIVECEGCEAHAHKECVPTIWAAEEDPKAAGSPAAGAPQPFKFACPACEEREPAVSYSETCTLQTSTQNGYPSRRVCTRACVLACVCLRACLCARGRAATMCAAAHACVCAAGWFMPPTALSSWRPWTLALLAKAHALCLAMWCAGLARQRSHSGAPGPSVQCNACA